MNRDALTRRRMVTIAVYTVAAVVVFVAGVLIFSVMERNTDFAI